MRLVPAALLALPGRVDDPVLDAAVARTGGGVPHRVLEHHAVVAEDADAQDGLDDSRVPAAVGEQGVAGLGLVPDVLEGLLAPRDVLGRPAVVAGVAQKLRRVDELEPLQGRPEFAVRAGDSLQAPRPDVDDVPRLVRVPDVLRDVPHQGVLVGRGGVIRRLVLVVVRAASPGGDLAGVRRRVVVGGPAVRGHGLVSRVDRVLLGGDRGSHTVEVLLGVQDPRVGEGEAGGPVLHGYLGVRRARREECGGTGCGDNGCGHGPGAAQERPAAEASRHVSPPPG